MKPLSEVTTDTLYWVQPKHAQGSFELLDGEELIGTLQWEAFWGWRATAEVADNRWTIKRTRIFPPRFAVRAAGSESDLATYKPGGLRNTSLLTLQDGNTYHWTSRNLSVTEFDFSHPHGQILLRFKLERRKLSEMLGGTEFKTRVRVEIVPKARALPDFPMLLVLSAHLMAIQDLSR